MRFDAIKFTKSLLFSLSHLFKKLSPSSFRKVAIVLLSYASSSLLISSKNPFMVAFHSGVGMRRAFLLSLCLGGVLLCAFRFARIRKHYQEKYPVVIAEIVVGYSFTITFIIEIITTILPGLFYLQILNIYVTI